MLLIKHWMQISEAEHFHKPLHLVKPAMTPGDQTIGGQNQSANIEIRARISLKDGKGDHVEAIAARLEKSGFRVTSTSRWGIGIIARKSLYEEVFQSRLRGLNNDFSFESEVTIPSDLQDSIQSLYFPTKPINF